MKAKQIGWILVGAVVGILVACSGSGNADSTSGLTQSQVQTLITAALTPLQSEITDLQAQVKTLQAASSQQAAVFIRAPNAGAAIAASIRQTRGLRNLAISNAVGGGSTLPSPCNWTLTGRPSSSDPLLSSTYSGISCTGYNFNVSAATTDTTGVIQQLPPYQYMVIFDGANCTGDAYLVPTSTTTRTILVLAQSGAVFTFDPNKNPNQAVDPSDASKYWYLKAGTNEVSVNEASYWNGAAATSCYNGYTAAGPFGVDFTHGWPIQQNDPSVTGIPSAPIPGPVLIGN